jgi:prevent-host-death family protein
MIRLVRLVYTGLGDRMATRYSTYEAKARFSEILRRVRAGHRAVITYRGKAVAEIRPIAAPGKRLEDSLEELERDGILSPGAGAGNRATGPLKPVAKRPGALARFLESRE